MRIAIVIAILIAAAGCATTDCSQCPARTIKVGCWDPPERPALPPRPVLEEIIRLTLEQVQTDYGLLFRTLEGDKAALAVYAAQLEHEWEALWGAIEASELPSCVD
jgi:hypothetical protein